MFVNVLYFKLMQLYLKEKNIFYLSTIFYIDKALESI